MAFDLEDELLRAAQRLCRRSSTNAFTIDVLRELIVTEPREFPRLAHRLLSYLVDPLAARLVAEGLLVRVEGGYALTEDAQRYLDRAPVYLHAPEARPRAEVVKEDNLAIASFRWGQIVDSTGRVFRDARLFPGGIEEWDWRKTGTRHDPGIQIADLEDLLSTKPDLVILSRGVELVLQVPETTVDFAREHSLNVLVLQSEQAVAEYNKRIADERVVALIHSTC